MKNVIKLSLIAFISLTNAEEISYDKVTLTSNQVFQTNPYSNPTEITVNADKITLGASETVSEFNNLKIGLSNSTGQLVISGYANLNNVDIFKNSQADAKNHGLIIDNNGSISGVTINQGSLKNIGVNLFKNANYNDSLIFESLDIDNIIYGGNTTRSANLFIVNSQIKDSKFVYETIVTNSTLTGKIEGALDLQGGNTINSNFDVTNLKLTNENLNGTDIRLQKDNSQFIVDSNVSLQDVKIHKDNASGADSHGVIIMNNNDFIMNGGELTNVALNLNSSSGGHNKTATLNNIVLDNVKYGYNTALSANLVINNSTIKNSDFKHSTNISNSTLTGKIKGDLNLQGGNTINSNFDVTNLKLTNENLNGTDIRLQNDDSQFIVDSNVGLQDVKIHKDNASGADSKGVVILNNNNFAMNGGNLTNVAIDLDTADGGHTGSSTLNNVSLDNVKVGYQTDLSTNLTIQNANINNSDFKHSTNISNSTLTGTNAGNLIIQDNSQIHGTINASNLKISDLDSTTYTHSKLNISSSTDIELINTTLDEADLSLVAKGRLITDGVIFKNVNISKANINNKDIHGIIIRNNTDFAMEGGSLKNISLNVWGSNAHSGKVTISDADISNVDVGYATKWQTNLVIKDSRVTNLDSNQTTTIDNSILSGTNKGDLKLTNGTKIQGDIEATGLILDNASDSGALSQLNIASTGNINLANNSTINNSSLSGKIVTIDNSTFDGSKYRTSIQANGGLNISGKSSISSANLNGSTINIDDSTINSTGSKTSITASGNINITGSSTVQNADITGAAINIDSSTIKGNLNDLISFTNGSGIKINNSTLDYVRFSDSTKGRIDIFGTSIFNNVEVSNASVINSHHITITNDANVTFNGGTFTNTAFNSFSSNDKNTITLNNATLINTSIGNAATGSSSPIYINGGSITNTDENVVVKAGTIYLNDVDFKSDIDGASIHVTNGDDKVVGTLKSGTVFYEEGQTFTNLAYEDGAKIYRGKHILNNTQMKRSNPADIRYWSGNIRLDRNSELTYNQANLENLQIDGWTVFADTEPLNNTVTFTDSIIVETGIGATMSGDIPLITENLILDNTSIDNKELNNIIRANNIIIKNSSNINAPEIKTVRNDYSHFDGTHHHFRVTKQNTNISIENSSIDANIEAEKFNLDSSTLNGNITNTQTINISNGSTLNGDVLESSTTTCKDEGCNNDVRELNISNSTMNGDIKDIGEVNLTDSELNATSVQIKDNLNINNSTQKNISGAIVVGNNITSKNATFTGTVSTAKLLSDNSSIFKDEVSAGSIDAVGSTFEKTLTITGDDQNNSLNNATLKQGLNVSSKDAKVSISNGSNIEGAITNEGYLRVDKDSHIPTTVSGSGTLETHAASYAQDVVMGKISGENNIFNADVKITDESDINLSQNTFKGENLVVDKGTINADGSYTIKNINSKNMNIKNDDTNTKDILTAKNITINDTLLIENIDVKTAELKASKASITNSNVTSEIFLKGTQDSATSVYDSAAITSGDYTIKNSAIKGGIRVAKLTVDNSNIVGQLAVNTLNASNSTFYITGGGYDTSLYQHFSGAIIAKERASGGGNIINISNTNLAQLINGYVPVAIINNISSPKRTSETAATSPDFFTLTYTTPVSTVLLSSQIVHFDTFQDASGLKQIWSVGLAGKKLSADEIKDIIEGKGQANYASTEPVDKNYRSFILSESFDAPTKDILNNIIYSPYFIAANTKDILDNRASDIRQGERGFWLKSAHSYTNHQNTAIKHNSMSLGIDRAMGEYAFGLYMSKGTLKMANSTDSRVDSEVFGMYGSYNHTSGAFIDANLAYAKLKNKMKAERINLDNDYRSKLYQASLAAGFNTEHFEPSIKLIATSFKDYFIHTKNIDIFAKSSTQYSLEASLKARANLANNLQLQSELIFSQDLNKSAKATARAMLDTDFAGLKNRALAAKLGLVYKASDSLNIKANLAKTISQLSDDNYQFNLGLSYKF